MDIIVKLNKQTAGRDKIIRLMQYASRAYWYYAQTKNGTAHSVNVFKSLEYTFSSFRKLLRLGRFLDSLYSALDTIRHPDIVLRATLTLSRISDSLYLLADHIIWLSRAGIFRVNLDKWNRTANKYWLMTLTMNLARDLYEITQVMENRVKSRFSRKKSHFGVDPLDYIQHLRVFRYRQDILLDTVKNFCDIFIPLTALGYAKLTPGAVGLLGLVSSAAGIYGLVRPELKLVPS